MIDKNQHPCRWRNRKRSCAIILILFFIALVACSGVAHAQRQVYSHQASHLKHNSGAGVQKVRRADARPQKEQPAATDKIQRQASDLRNRFHQEVTRWGNSHLYHDSYNKVSYPLDYEYNLVQGFGADVDSVVDKAHSVGDYQAAIKQITTNLTHLQAMEAEAADKTSWSLAHASDLKLIHYYHLTGKIVVVSFIDQACRVYQDGRLIKAFQVTTGNYASPSPAGLWHIFQRQSPTIFRSPAPVGSRFWYPNTPISYAMEYRVGGYYLHDSWWRTIYGPRTNFPHYDPSGGKYSAEGSHGCINMPLVDAAWMYANTRIGTAVIAY